MASNPPLLSDYLTSTRRLLHDATGQYWPDAELIDYINQARLRVVADTGCNRVLQSVSIMPGVQLYSFGGVSGAVITAGGSGYAAGTYALGIAGGSGAGAAGTYTCSGGAVTSISITNQGDGYNTTAPTLSFPSGGGSNAAATATIILDNTFDVLNVTLIWGSLRIPMMYMPFTEFNLKMRAWTQFQSRPTVFSVYGSKSVYVGPVPDQVYATEWDTVVAPSPLVNYTDQDMLPFPYNSPVPYYAAYLAKYKEQSYEESDRFLADYTKQTLMAIRSSFTRRLPLQ